MGKLIILVAVILLTACANESNQTEKQVESQKQYDETYLSDDTIRIEAIRETQYIMNDSGKLETIDLMPVTSQ